MKDRDKRFPSVLEMLQEIKAVGEEPKSDQSLSERSIVVLPFEDISPNRDNEYCADGLTEEIISDLSRIHSLRVICRTSAMRLKATDEDIGTIGKKS